MQTVEIKNRKIGQDMPKICVPLIGRTDEDLLKGADEILSVAEEYGIDIVEFRGDYYERLNDKNSLNHIMEVLKAKFADIIFLFTIRSYSEGGERLSFDTPDVNTINSFVVKNKLADIVDVELFSSEMECKSLINLAKENNIKIIMSNHDFNTTPSSEEIVTRLTTMQSYGADIAKIAVMPENLLHVIDLLKATAIMKEKYNSTPVVTISMGKMGAISRISGEIFGSAITFATLSQASAPGQISVKEVSNLLKSIKENLI